MKKFILLVFALILSNCSFDNKTGIWENSNQVDLRVEKRFKDFKTLYSKEKTFNSIIVPPKDLKIILDPGKTTVQWLDEFYQNSNNLDNYNYKDINELIFKSRKISRKKIKENILFDGKNIIASDVKGNIIIYSFEEKQIIYKYNFYKKKYKKLNKKLYFVIEKNIIYVGDNLGYIYALDYSKDKLLWAKDYKIPFRSNLKISNDNIILADQNNSLYVLNKFSGERIKFVPTEEVILKNDFISSIALDKDSLFYLNTYGSLYSINRKNYRINWFINLNQSLDLNLSSLFFSNPILIHKEQMIISTDPYLYLINLSTGSTISRIAVTSIVKPIASGQNLFLITKDNLLICINLEVGKIIYSLDINKEIADFFNTKSKRISIKSLSLVNNNLFLFLDNSYLVQFTSKGKIKKINKLSGKLGTYPIFVNKSILYFNKKNNLIVLN